MSEKEVTSGITRRNAHKPQPFVRSIIDWWVLALGCIGVGAILLLMPLVALEVTSVGARVVAVVFLLISAIFITDSLFFLHYRITSKGLLIATQLRHLTISFRDMEKIEPGGISSLISRFGHRRFALSAKRSLVISLGKRSGLRSVSISPEHHQVFLEQLLYAIDVERSKRASVVRT